MVLQQDFGYKGDVKFEIFTLQKWGHPTVFEIDCWNFQQMLDLGFSETSQNFSSFRQLFSKGGPKEKTQKPTYSFGNCSEFFLWSSPYNLTCACEEKHWNWTNCHNTILLSQRDLTTSKNDFSIGLDKFKKCLYQTKSSFYNCKKNILRFSKKDNSIIHQKWPWQWATLVKLSSNTEIGSKIRKPIKERNTKKDWVQLNTYMYIWSLISVRLWIFKDGGS